jgi:hypothetical protein
MPKKIDEIMYFMTFSARRYSDIIYIKPIKWKEERKGHNEMRKRVPAL